jgi:hypothetical protein
MLTSHSNSNEYGCHMDIVEHCSSGLARITLISSSTPRHHSLGIRDIASVALQENPWKRVTPPDNNRVVVYNENPRRSHKILLQTPCKYPQLTTQCYLDPRGSIKPLDRLCRCGHGVEPTSDVPNAWVRCRCNEAILSATVARASRTCCARYNWQFAGTSGSTNIGLYRAVANRRGRLACCVATVSHCPAMLASVHRTNNRAGSRCPSIQRSQAIFA